MNKYELYKALQSHTLAYPGNNPASNLPWTTSDRIDDIMRIKAEADTKIAEIEAAEKIDDVVNDTAEHDAVNDYLISLEASDPIEFDRVRKLAYSEQLILANG